MFTQQVWRQTWEVINLNKNAKHNPTAGIREEVLLQDHSAAPYEKLYLAGTAPGESGSEERDLKAGSNLFEN